MEKKAKYNKSNITPQTRLMDLVNKKYHSKLKAMIDELRQVATLTDDTAWWKVKKVTFTHPKSMRNYEPIAKFIMQITQEDNNGLNCSVRTFIWYLTSIDHSNLNMTQGSAKALIYSIIKYLKKSKNGIF
jgi:hypothetical protein